MISKEKNCIAVKLGNTDNKIYKNVFFFKETTVFLIHSVRLQVKHRCSYTKQLQEKK